MSKSLDKQQIFQDHLDEIEQIMEREKVKLTPEVEAYLQENVQRITEMIAQGEMPSEEDFEFFKMVKRWIKMPVDFRFSYPSIESMMKSGEMEGAVKRQITWEQWLDLLYLSEIAHEGEEWIDSTFRFLGQGKMELKKNLSFDSQNLTHLPEGIVSTYMSLDCYCCTSLTHLPSSLRSVRGLLNLNGCTSLNHLPDDLTVSGWLILKNCSSLTHLPDNLTVTGGKVDLIGCTALTSLPNTFSVQGDLYLSEDLNPQVKEDAERLKQEGKIKGNITYG